LRIDFGSLDGSLFRDAPLRYRLLPQSSEWRDSYDGSAQFQDLGNGSYSMEIAYAGDEGSAVGAWEFRIGSAPPFISWYWPTLFVTSIGTLAIAVRRLAWLESVNFRINKALFLLRRRYSRKPRHSSSPSLNIEPENYCGQLLCKRYLLTDVISRGGFSVVYAARDLRNQDARVAIKILNRDSRASGDSWVRNRFAHEVAALRSVQHPAVVGILDSWIARNGEPCLAMPFLAGETLRDVLQRGDLSPSRTARLSRDLAGGLAAIHQRGMVHRDLKPENVIVEFPGTEREHAVIIDLGTAGLRQAEYDLAVTTLMAGSFHYMAPERLTGHYSPASDVFSLGVIILETLTGKRLGDLNAMCSDPAFRSELEAILWPKLGAVAAPTVADLLASACSLEPRLRPSAVDVWAEQVAKALDQH
jgi:serine/threonine protein kinase